MYRLSFPTASLASLVLGLLVGCQNLPGSDEEQGAVAGGAAGAVIGQAAGDSLLATLLGGAAGAGAGYLIGANKDKIVEQVQGGDQDAEQAVQEAQTDPATAEDVAGSETADLNDDGFVTTDEVIAMEEAGLEQQDTLERLRATDQIFELNEDQQSRLVDAGVSPTVVAQMNEINRAERERLKQEREVISQEPRQT